MAIKKNRMQSNEERNNKIEQMGLAELKPYLCMKNYQNPEKCKDCQGVKTCKAGQRAVLLLNEREVKQVIDSGYKGKTMEQRREIARKKFVVAAAQDNPIEYVMKMDGNNRNAAREKLKHWAEMFPDIAEQYEFWNKLAGVCSKVLGHFRSGPHKNTLSAIGRYKEAAAQSDPIAYVMEKYGWERKQALHNYSQWKSRYGKVEEEQEVKKEPEENDEVSVEEFLAGIEEEVVDTVSKIEDEPPVQNVSEAEVSKVAPPPVIETNIDFYGELNVKYFELKNERDSLKARITWIEMAMDALVTTAKFFEPDKELGHVT